MIASTHSKSSSTIQTTIGPVELGYDGRSLTGDLIALDTETTGLDLDGLALVLLVASDGRRRVVVPPEQAGKFLEDHEGKHWAFHNVGFDFWVLHDHLEEQRGEGPLFRQVQRHLVHDSMLLASLVDIASAGRPNAGDGLTGTAKKGLEHLAARFSDVPIDKEADARYRQHYRDILGRDFKTVADEDPGWFDYAIRDAEATWQVAMAMLYESMRLASEQEVLAASLQQYGLLSEQVQIRGAIALADIERNGIAVDPELRAARAQEIENELLELAIELDGLVSGDPEFAAIGSPVKRDPDDARPCRTPRGAVKLDTARRDALLERVARRQGEPVPRTKDGKLSTREDDWARFKGMGKDEQDKDTGERFVSVWLRLGKAGRLLGFLPAEGREHTHPSHRSLLATGRTSCSNPNVQQLPRQGGIREIYRARPGHVLIGADYGQLELRTLAQHCLDHFGQSRLNEAFEAGEDPHELTAASIVGMSPDAFKALKKSDPERYERDRQAAKAANFGFPGGLGPHTFVGYAFSTYGVELDEAGAKRIRGAWETAYPEVKLHLGDDPLERVARAAGMSKDDFRLQAGYPLKYDMPEWFPTTALNILLGKKKANGEDYAASNHDRVWDALAEFASTSELRTAGQQRYLDPHRAERLTSFTVTTRTGRVRANCSFCASRNTPFQGLAADGAKLALYDLVRQGVRIVAFIHDEIVIEVPEDSDLDAAAEQLKRSMIDAMRLVCPDVPIEVSAPAASYTLTKHAKAVYDHKHRLVPWTGSESDRP